MKRTMAEKPPPASTEPPQPVKEPQPPPPPAKEPDELDPTRYGDWERGGRCIDF